MHYLNDPKMSSNDVQTLANSIIGTSILAMPFCFAKCGIILSIVLLIISTAITRACCNYLIKVSIVTRRRNMELLGSYCFGKGGKCLVEISVIGFLMGTCIAFYVVIGDLSPILISKIFNIPNTTTLRLWMILITTFILIIPLSFQQSIKSLSFVCKASIAFYICLTVKTVFESFNTFHNDDNWTSKIELWNFAGVLQCIPIFSMAMSCQMVIFEVYENISSYDRIRQNIYHATSICLAVYSTVGFFGYVAFYNENLSGNILVNFRPSLSNDIITFGFILSIACSFPLAIFPCRTSLNSLLQKSKIHHHSEISSYVPESRYKPLTLFIIFITMIIGILVPSVEVIIGFVGSTIGILICVLFPATCFIKIMQRNTGEKFIAQILIIAGIICMVLGTISNLMAWNQQSLIMALNKKDVPEIIPVVNIPPVAPIIIDQLPESVIRKKNLSESAVKKMAISEDGIKKEELEMAVVSALPVETNDVRAKMKEKDIEIKELKESKKKLENDVLEIKQELVKHNKDTEIILQKFDEIAEKVDKIQSMDNKEESKDEDGAQKKEIESLKNKEEKVSDDHKKDINNDVVDLILNDKTQSIREDEHRNALEISNQEADKKHDTPLKLNENEVLNEEAVVKIPEKYAKNEVKKADGEEIQKHASIVADPIVKHIVEKSQEPLSYQVGEQIMEEKKKNSNAVEKSSNKTHSDASHEDLKNEMRRKRRDAVKLDEEIIFLASDSLDVQMKSMLSLGRDLKAIDNEEI